MAYQVAEYYKQYFPFIQEWGRKKDISHHLQYLDYLYDIKRSNNPDRTYLSLTNKTIIVEFFAISEAIIDALLCEKIVDIGDGKLAQLYVKEYTNASTLLKMAEYYEIIDKNIYGQLLSLSKTRNFIHIKRPKSGKLECNHYTDAVLKRYENYFENFLSFLFNKYKVYETYGLGIFAWPWK